MTALRWNVAWLAIASLAPLAGCGGTKVAHHPTTNVLDPAFATATIKTIAVLPFASDVGDEFDPDKVAPGLCESKLLRSLYSGSGFTLLSSSEVARALEKDGLQARVASFYKKWISDQGDVDANVVKQVAAAMKADAVLAGAVDVWHQQAVDITESGTARTSVGLLVGLFDGRTGMRFWLGRDENFKEAVRYTPAGEGTEVGRKEQERALERTNRRTAGGVHAPPEYADVVDLVVAPLVQAFPKHRP